jgi:dTDP-D-glucose 4,6-dehydratase
METELPHKIFVTGGAGFIGSNFVRRMLERDVEITNLDAMTYAGVPATVAELDAYCWCDRNELEKLPLHGAHKKAYSKAASDR